MDPIEDYAVIGDCRSAALVSKRGSIDWLCWPRFDSPSIFGALLDPRAGHWRITPTHSFRTERRYRRGTNVLETTFLTSSGKAVLTDLMPVASEVEKRRLLLPDHELLRVLACESGEVELEMLLDVRPRYGREQPRPKHAGQLGWRIETSQGLFVLRAEAPIDVDDAGRVHARLRLRAGQRLHCSLTLADEWPAVLPPLGEGSRLTVERSIGWWREWISKLGYDDLARDHVERSALVLKLLVYAPSGAVIAAPTMSLPERVGGDLNWDYRYCWLRDASLTMRALFGLGFAEEAETFLSWLLHSTRLTRPQLRVLYDIYGNEPPPERILNHLEGYRSSRPIRVGNAAAEQLQLDVYGEVIDAATQFARRGGSFDRETQRMLGAFGSYVCKSWRLPDAGLWEPRSQRQHHTHSRLLCWTAVDRLLELHARGLLPRAPVHRLAATRDEIRHDIEEHAWSKERQSYVATLGGREVDASLLLVPWYGFEDAPSERMRLTYERLRQELQTRKSLFYRYRTGDPPSEGAFGICSFWAVEFLALGGGSLEEAQDAFEDLCGYANDVGLFAEEIDPATGSALGNFPQAFTHIGLINAALSLSQRRARRQTTKSHIDPRRRSTEVRS